MFWLLFSSEHTTLLLTKPNEIEYPLRSSPIIEINTKYNVLLFKEMWSHLAKHLNSPEMGSDMYQPFCFTWDHWKSNIMEQKALIVCKNGLQGCLMCGTTGDTPGRLLNCKNLFTSTLQVSRGNKWEMWWLRYLECFGIINRKTKKNACWKHLSSQRIGS